MPESISSSPEIMADEPKLRRLWRDPKGVIQKNLKALLYLLAAGLVIAAAVFSGRGTKTAEDKTNNGHQPPQPVVQDNTDNNVQSLKEQLAAAEQQIQQAQQAAQQNPPNQPAGGMTPAQQAAAASYGVNGQPAPCIPGQPCAQQGGYGQPQISPAQQEEQQLAAKDRELTYNSRFASNLVYTRAPDQPSSKASITALRNSLGATGPQRDSVFVQAGQEQSASNLLPTRVPGDPPATAPAQNEHRAEVNIDSATGKPYVIYEGTTLDTVLMNRLDGDAAGPVKVLASNPVYSHDRQHVLIPEGTVVLGEARKIGSAGFGQQRRMAIVFHRMIMPDGYSVDLDQFQGLDQSGAEGLKDKVNNHYFEIFGTSIALGVIAGASQIGAGGGTITTSGSQAFTTGAASSVSQSATTVLDRFIQIPPTITIREGHRVKVYFMQDLLLPAYENHTIPQSF